MRYVVELGKAGDINRKALHAGSVEACFVEQRDMESLLILHCARGEVGVWCGVCAVFGVDALVSRLSSCNQFYL